MLHDRRIVVIDNPHYQPGNPDSIRRVDAVQSLRDDPLGQMHERHQIDEAQYEAGRRFQATWERAGRSGRLKGMDTTQEPVDGSPPRGTGITDRTINAGRNLDKWRGLLGDKGWELTEGILIRKWTVNKATLKAYGQDERAWKQYTGKRFRECLDRLAKDMGLAD